MESNVNLTEEEIREHLINLTCHEFFGGIDFLNKNISYLNQKNKEDIDDAITALQKILNDSLGLSLGLE